MNEYDRNRNKLPYTLAFRVPPEAERMIATFHRRLAGLCSRFDPVETAHLTVKYLGYSSPAMAEAEIVGMIPTIARLAKPFLPLRVFVRGLDMFSTEPPREPVIFLKVLPNPQLAAFHDAIRIGLGKRIDMFPHADGPNFIPHITISKEVPPDSRERLHRLLLRSHKTAKRDFKLVELVLYTPTATYPVLSVQGPRPV